MRAPFAAVAALTLLTTAACGGPTPSTELKNARTAYNAASTSRAAEYNPASLLSARQALQKAEREFDEDPGSDEERSYGYVAQRRAEIAMVEGDTAYEAAQKQSADAEYARLEKEMGALRQAELEASQDRIQSLEAEAAALGSVKTEERGTVVTLSGQVLFETGESELLPAAKESLAKIGQVLAKGTGQVLVEGHTDSRGSEKSNEELSMKRAESVRDFLVEQGVAAERITTEGLGEAKALASNDTSEGRAINRRVELVIQPPGEPMTPASGKTPEKSPKHKEHKK